MKAIIYGVSGQDGAYLARHLLEKGYEVYGTSRDAQTSSFANLVRLGVRDQIKLVSVAVNDFRSVLQSFIKARPDEVYYLAGQSSVGLSFDQPVETMESVSVGILNILEAMRFTGGNAKLYNAGSSECFGNTGLCPANESTPFSPRSPYAVAKAAAYWQVATYREAYNLYACTGILFNHESPLRPERFVTRKIVATACRIAAGIEDKLYLGNIRIVRDWGWAPEYVEAMWMMLQREKPEDFVIATGESHSLEDFIRTVFGYLGLDWKQYIETDSTLLRPADLINGMADPTKAKEVLGWSARNKMDDVVRLMLEADRRLTG